MRPVKKGSTDQSVVIRIVDSGDGTPETGVVFNTSGIDLWYRREGATKASITEATLSALNDAHSDGGVLHIGDGYYRLDLPDAAVATGANGVAVGGTVTGMVVIGCYVPLVDFDPYDTVRFGLTALPNAAAEAPGGLYTRGSGAGQINQPANGQIDVNVEKWNATNVPAEATAGYPVVTVKVGTGTGELNVASGKAPATIAAGDLASNSLTAAALAADAVTEIQSGLATAAALATVDGIVDDILVDTADMQPKLGTPATSVSADIAAVHAKTTNLPSDPADASVVAGLIAAVETKVDTVDTVVDAVKAKTDNLPSDPADQSLVIAATDALATLIGTVDTVVDAIKVETDKLADTLVDQGGGTYGFTEASLQEAPTGEGGGGTDWSADERTALRSILGIPGSGTTPADPSTGILDTIRDSVATRASQTSVDDLPTNAELATALGTADDAVLSAIAALNNLSIANVRTAVGLASANLDTQLDALPTAAELTAALAAADDAILAAVAALNNLSAAQVLAQVNTALTTAVADSVPADGSRPSIAQAAYISTQFLLERAVSGTTMEIRKPDGSTALLTLTLNDATTPTALTRAT